MKMTVQRTSIPEVLIVERNPDRARALAASLEKVTAREPLLTLEMDGGGPAGRIFATASPAGWVRAFVANPQATVAPTRGP